MIDVLKTKIFLTILLPLLILIAFLAVMPASTAGAADIKGNLCGGTNLTLNSSDQCQGGQLNAQGVCVYNGAAVDAGRCHAESSFSHLLTLIINVFSVVVGIVAVIMIIWGGFRFITSGGDSTKVTSARNTIIYAIIGLIIVALAQTIAKFVLEKTPTG